LSSWAKRRTCVLACSIGAAGKVQRSIRRAKSAPRMTMR